MNEPHDATHPSRLWILLVGVLLVVVATMAYSMYQMNAKLETIVAGASPSSSEMAANQPSDAPTSLDFGSPSILPDEPFDVDSWSPFREMEAMQRRVESLFNESFGRFNQSGRFGDAFTDIVASPRLDLTDEGDKFVARLDIPGAEDSRIDVTIEGQILTVEATSSEKAAKQDPAGQVLQEERHVGTFRRQVKLPEPVKTDNFDTEYKDGVLTVTVFKAERNDSDS